MDSVRHMIGAARSGLTGLTRGRRVLYGVLGGAVLATAVGFAVWPQQQEMAVLFTGLSPVDAAAALEELAHRDVPVELGGRGRTISVPATARDRLRLDLMAMGIGTETQLAAAGGDEGRGTPTGLPPDRDRRGALEAELAKSVESLQGIQSARVHLLLPQAGARPGEGREPAASVLLRLDGHGQLGEDRIAGIQALVAAGVGELAPENVTVVDQDGSVLSAPLRDKDPGRGIQRLEMRKEVESYLADKVTGMLDRVLGTGRSVVRVDVTLNFEKIEREREIYDPTMSVVRSETRSETSGSGAGDSEQSETSYEINRTVERIVGDTGGIQNLSVAVFVDGRRDTPEEGAAPTYRPVAEDELAQLRRIVQTAVGFNASRGDQIEVVNLPFQRPAEPVVTGNPQPHWFAQVAYLGSRALLVAALVTIVLMLRRNVGILLGRSHAQPGPLAGAAAAARRAEPDFARFAGDREMKPQVVQDIQDYASENPERVAEVIQAWIQDIDLGSEAREKVGG